MKKALLNSVVLFTLAACGGENSAKAPAPVAASASVEVAKVAPPAPEMKLIEDTQHITDQLKTIPTLGKVVIYTEDTDPNNLLGRPGQYVGKLNFGDTRYKDKKAEDFATIEIFKTEAERDARHDYVDNVTKGTPFFMYQYKHENLLMRLPHEMTPTQAKEYEAALNRM